MKLGKESHSYEWGWKLSDTRVIQHLSTMLFLLRGPHVIVSCPSEELWKKIKICVFLICSGEVALLHMFINETENIPSLNYHWKVQFVYSTLLNERNSYFDDF